MQERKRSGDEEQNGEERTGRENEREALKEEARKQWKKHLI